MLWMKMLQNITQLSYYYLPQSKGSWRVRNWKLFFLLDLYFFPIRSVEMRKDYGCSIFFTTILVAIFSFLQQQEAEEKKEFHQGGGRRLKGRRREGMGH